MEKQTQYLPRLTSFYNINLFINYYLNTKIMKTLIQHILRTPGVIICAIFFSLMINTSNAATTWVGGVNASWSNNLNWNPQFVPGPTDDVVIPFLSSGFSYPVMDESNININSLSIASLAQLWGTPSASIKIAGDAVISGRMTTNGASAVFMGDVTGAGTLDGGNSIIYIAGDMMLTAYVDSVSTVILNGSGIQKLRAYTFYNLTISNTGDGIILIGGPTVTNQLTMNSGNIALNNQQLTLGAGITMPGTLVWNSGFMTGSFGSFRRWFSTAYVPMGSMAGLFPMGTNVFNRSLWISSTPTIGGWIALSHVDSNARSFINPPFTEAAGALGTMLVNVRYGTKWVMTTDSIIASGLALRIEGNGIPGINDYNRLTMSLANSAAPGMFATATGSNANPQANRVFLTASNLNNAFYLASDSSINPLPVTLMSFVAAYRDGMVNLDWKTASEINNSHFDVERSADGHNWAVIGTVDGHGTSNVVNNYAFVDGLSGIVPAGPIFYRLKQVDFNGAYEYSEIRSINNNAVSATLDAYPNPTMNLVTLSWMAGNYENIDFRVLDLSGHEILKEKLTGNGPMTKQLDLTDYKPGTYLVQMVSSDKTMSQVIYKR